MKYISYYKAVLKKQIFELRVVLRQESKRAQMIIKRFASFGDHMFKF